MTVRISASTTIMNPWYQVPPYVVLVRVGVPDSTNHKIDITSASRVELPGHGIRLFFQDNWVGLVFASDSSAQPHLINPIRNYLVYRSFIDYNAFSPLLSPPDEQDFELVDIVRFKVERLIRIETEFEYQGERRMAVHHDSQKEQIELDMRDVAEYLNILNPTVYYAIAFYLIGCDNPRYFLVEYYKAVESIRHAFDGEKDFLDSLRPFGISKSSYKQFTKVCNDKIIAPLDIGRHAPEPDAPVYSVDVRNILLDPRSSELFESATTFTRKAIDAYLAFLVDRAA